MTKFVTVEIFGRPIVLSDSVKAFGFHGPVEMDVKDIFKCLVNNANVTEIIPGTRETHKLTLQNYNKGFDMSSNPVIVEKKEETKPIVNEVKPEPVVEYKKEDDPTTTLTSEIAEATPSSSEFIRDEDKSKGEQKPVLDNQQKQYYNKGKNKNYRR